MNGKTLAAVAAVVVAALAAGYFVGRSGHEPPGAARRTSGGPSGEAKPDSASCSTTAIRWACRHLARAEEGPDGHGLHPGL
jgi:hypothetical protein